MNSCWREGVGSGERGGAGELLVWVARGEKHARCCRREGKDGTRYQGAEERLKAVDTVANWVLGKCKAARG